MQRLSMMWSRHRAERDSGAVAIIFALSLTMLLGFVGLGVDVAAAYAKSQEVQNAADAGALAAAQSCAPGGSKCFDGDSGLVLEATDRAQDLAERNVRLEVETVGTAVNFPEDNQVTVAAEAQSQTFFVQLFGIDTWTLRENATAEWVTPKEGPAMLPLTISACTFYDQAGVPNLNSTVTLYLPNPNQGVGGSPQPEGCTATREDGSPYPPGGFGWLEPDGGCESTLDPVVGGWFEGGSDPGNNAPICVRNSLPGMLGDVVVLPIFEAQDGQGAGARYLIQRFAAFRIDGFHLQSGGISGGIACGPKPSPNNAYKNTCLVGTFIEWAEIGDDYSGGVPPTEVSVIRLVD